MTSPQAPDVKAASMPTANMTPDTEVLTTWGVLQGYMAQIKERDAEIERLTKSYNLAIASRLEWRRQAETTNRRLLETHEAYEEMKARALAAEAAAASLLERLERGVAEERAACAQLAYPWSNNVSVDKMDETDKVRLEIASSIRARG